MPGQQLTEEIRQFAEQVADLSADAAAVYRKVQQ